MIQEFITYMIIGAAIALAVSQAIKKFSGRKRAVRKVNFKKDSLSLQHDCSDCAAECMLRNAAKPVIKENIDLCSKTEVRKRL